MNSYGNPIESVINCQNVDMTSLKHLKPVVQKSLRQKKNRWTIIKQRSKVFSADK